MKNGGSFHSYVNVYHLGYHISTVSPMSLGILMDVRSSIQERNRRNNGESGSMGYWGILHSDQKDSDLQDKWICWDSQDYIQLYIYLQG